MKSWSYKTNVLLTAILVAFGFLAVCFTMRTMTNNEARGTFAHEQKPMGNESLTIAEDATIRKVIYKPGVKISVTGPGKLAGIRALVIDDEVMRLYEKKRVGTLRLLLDIVKGGRPEDAIKASAYAVALGGDLVTAAVAARLSPELMDEAIGDPPITHRVIRIEMVEKLLESEEKLRKNK